MKYKKYVRICDECGAVFEQRADDIWKANPIGWIEILTKKESGQGVIDKVTDLCSTKCLFDFTIKENLKEQNEGKSKS